MRMNVVTDENDNEDGFKNLFDSLDFQNIMNPLFSRFFQLSKNVFPLDEFEI